MNFAKTALALMALIPLACSSDEPQGVERNKHYIEIPQQVTTAAAHEVEVAEVFWYGCPHCFQLEPAVQKWKATKNANIKFVRIPAPLNPRWEVHARAFYTAELLGLGDKLHQPMFNAIHLQNNRLQNRNLLKAFFATHGVSASSFDAAFDSFAVTTKVNRDKVLIGGYNIRSVPTLIVDGKYTVTARHHTSYDNMMETVQKLAMHELAKKTPAPSASTPKAAVEVKTEAAAETKAAGEVLTNIGVKTETKVEAKVETKTEAKTESKTETDDAATEAKAETKTEAKAEAEAEAK